MPASIIAFVRYVDIVNRTVGRFAMYMIFGMMALLLYSSISKAFFVPSLWTLEMAQFAMAAYYMLGGGYSMQLDAHVRMDLAYGSWTTRTRAFADSITAFCLVFYLCLLLFGGFSSTGYAIRYSEESYSSWAPVMWPIKSIMTFGIALMLLQAIAFFFKDLARFRGVPMDDVTPASERAT
jgi:TRAP-type mannitol/chloroaromatic compound transport system permease small subunit